MNRVLLGWILASAAACAVGWTPVTDEVYLQEIGHKPMPASIKACAA